MKDLIVLVADLDTENVLKGLLPRLPTNGLTRPFEFEIYRHPDRDPGCLKGAHDFLRLFPSSHTHALVIFDHEGCGQENTDPNILRGQILDLVEKNGWDRLKIEALLIVPEIENWIWMKSRHVATALKWNDPDELYEWLAAENLIQPGEIKPDRPKEAMQTALKKRRNPGLQRYTMK